MEGTGGAANQIVSATLPGSVVVGYSHDANGNRTQRAQGGHTDVYSYDYENRLVGLNYQTGASGTGMYNYSYDYRTRRAVRVEPTNNTTQIVFEGGTSIEEFGASGPDFPGVEYLRGYNYGGGVGGLEYSVRSGFANFNQYDSRGDVVAQTNAAGTLTFQTGYEGFGSQTVTNGGTADRQKANTKENDPTGLLNEGFRYRDLQTGTFITRDPLGFKAGPNFYTYVRQNPWTKFDPEGLFPLPPDSVIDMIQGEMKKHGMDVSKEAIKEMIRNASFTDIMHIQSKNIPERNKAAKDILDKTLKDPKVSASAKDELQKLLAPPSPTPSASTPAHGASAPAPGTSAPAPGTSAPAPGTNAPAPGTNAPASGTSAPAPGTNAPASGTSAPASGTSAPASGTSAPAPGTNAPAPGGTPGSTQKAAPSSISMTPQLDWTLDEHYQWHHHGTFRPPPMASPQVIPPVKNPNLLP